jgi:hypothetical protein
MSSLRSGRVSRLPYRYRETPEVLVQKRKHVLCPLRLAEPIATRRSNAKNLPRAAAVAAAPIIAAMAAAEAQRPRRSNAKRLPRAAAVPITIRRSNIKNLPRAAAVAAAHIIAAMAAAEAHEPRRSNAKRLPRAAAEAQKRVSTGLRTPVRPLGWMPPHVRLSIEERKRLSSKMFLSNPLSDEYYTGSASWETFARERSLKQVWEPFAGDGKIKGEWAKLGVDCVMSIGDFWSNLQVPYGVDYIATNPPFSFKWLVLETLLAFKKSMAVILPWQSFYRNGLARLNWLQQEFGGHWKQIPMTSAGQEFWHPPDNDYKKIGCFILEWTW